MQSRDTRVDAYIAKAPRFARAILIHLRSAILGTSPMIEETIKWGMPHYTHHGLLCGMAAFKAHCSFGFWKGALVVGHADGRDDAMGDLGRITRISDLPARRTLQALVRKAMALNAGAHPVPRPLKHAKPPLRTPAELAKILRGNARARATWAALPPSGRRDYVDWIRSAKRADTRERRLAQAATWLAAGKSRHWKYQRGRA